MSDNRLCDDGISEIAAALRSNNTLTELNVSNCRITQQGASSLASALKQNRTIERLDVSKNSLYDEGVTAIAVAFQHTKSLVSLNISHCEQSHKCFKVLIGVFQSVPSMKELKVEGITFTVASDKQYEFHNTTELSELVFTLNSLRNQKCLPPLDICVEHSHVKVQATHQPKPQ